MAILHTAVLIVFSAGTFAQIGPDRCFGGVGGAVQNVGTHSTRTIWSERETELAYSHGPPAEFELSDTDMLIMPEPDADSSPGNDFDSVPRPDCPLSFPEGLTPFPPTGPYEPTGPWPEDEYICDGGDGNIPVRVRADWTVDGLNMEDTVGHFDTLDGRTIVEPTRRVCIYAPRFAAVRKISRLIEHRQQEQMIQFDSPIRPNVDVDRQLTSTVLQQAQPVGQIGRRPVNIFRERQGTGDLDQAQVVGTLAEENLPHESLRIIRFGRYDQAEKAQLAEYSAAAESWSHDSAVQVILYKTVALVEFAQQRPQAFYKLDSQGKPKMSVVKVASKKEALPGDIIDFALRFDNVGNERIGNVTLIDNLSPRLEYVPDSAQCDLDTDFFTRKNEGESLILRWEIKDPLEPGKGGVIRFQCQVR